MRSRQVCSPYCPRLCCYWRCWCRDCIIISKKRRGRASRGAAYIRRCCLMGHVASSRVAHTERRAATVNDRGNRRHEGSLDIAGSSQPLLDPSSPCLMAGPNNSVERDGAVLPHEVLPEDGPSMMVTALPRHSTMCVYFDSSHRCRTRSPDIARRW